MRRNTVKIHRFFAIPMITVVLSLLVGWVANIVQVVNIINDPINGYFILKCVGIFAAPLGGVLGLIGLF